MTEDQMVRLLVSLRQELQTAGFGVAPEHLLVYSGRVRAGYRIGETLFGGLPAKGTLLHVIGERPGSGHNTLSIYMTTADGNHWGIPDQIDHNITKVVSGIALTALQPEIAARDATKILVSG